MYGTQLYEQDFYLWLTHNADLLREGRLHQVDMINLVDEIEAMARNEKRAVNSNLVMLLLQLLKWKFQVMKRSGGWEIQINLQRCHLHDYLSDSPSLRPHLDEVFARCYSDARKLAASDTGFGINVFPALAPFTLEEVLTADYLPEEPDLDYLRSVFNTSSQSKSTEDK